MKSLIFTMLVCVFLTYTPVLPAAQPGPVSGTVAEAIESGGYVYIRLEDGTWIAANIFPVSEGDTIQYGGAMEMKNFHSQSLDRDFETILFVSEAGPAVASDAAGPATTMEGHGSMGMPIPKAAAVTAPQAGEVAALADGKTVAAIYAESAQLKGQEVSLNAKVIKISMHIMGKNWVTLQDGTGTEPDNRIMATTQEVVEPGDLVTAKGSLDTDVDLGYGYQYKVLLEQASFTPIAE